MPHSAGRPFYRIRRTQVPDGVYDPESVRRSRSRPSWQRKRTNELLWVLPIALLALVIVFFVLRG
ncbi:MAG: hypothetical protein SFU53_03845 [Terrimicrobiaceae bacterium]|nr:hypothetical protein [Terrimicrobiaceae bacterium]